MQAKERDLIKADNNGDSDFSFLIKIGFIFIHKN